MSDLLNQASLVMVPSGYKEDTVYSVVPSDGSGDLSFTRASNGTRINSAGLVEVCPWNLATYSEQFTNAIYTPKNGTFTDNFAVAPNGTTTAAKWEATDSDPYIYQAFTGANVDYTATCYVKATGTAIGKNSSIRIGGSVANFVLTGDWQQLTITANINGSVNVGVEAPESATSGEIVYIWGYQLNIGATAKPYFPTTDRLNVPRLTYQNGGGGCPSLLLEKQSTNLVLYSEELDNAAWSTVGSITITANNATSPDGTQNADLFSQPSSSAYRYQNLGVFSGTYTTSIFVKKGSQSSIAFGIVAGGFTGGMSVKFNLDTETFSTPTNYANWTSLSATYQNYGNGWYRLNLTGTTATSTTYFHVLGSLLESFAVNAYVYGAQLEASSYPTSYIVSTSSSATRVADLAVKSSISSLFGASATSLFMDFEITQVSSGGNWTITGYDGSNLFSLCQFDNASNFPRIVFDGGVDITLGTALSIGRHKIAVSFATNDFRAYIDGVLVHTDTSCTYNRYDRIAVNGTAWTGNTNNTNSFKLNEYAQFPNVLTNAELQALTA